MRGGDELAGHRAPTPDDAAPAAPEDPAALRRRLDVLAGLVDRHSAERRSILEAARQRRLERDQLARELARTRARLESAERTIDGLRRRKALRAATALRRLLPGRGSGPRGSAGPSGATIPPARPGATRSASRDEGTIGLGDPVPATLAGGTPAGYRDALLARLAGADAPGLRVAMSSTIAAGPDDAPAPPVGGWPDVVVIDDPSFDVRGMPRHVVTIARVADTPGRWLAAPWIDDVDIVIVRDDASATALAAGSAKTPVVRPDAIGGPADGAAIRDVLRAWVAARRFAILIQARSWIDARTSGDHFFARGLQRQLERRGHPTSVYLLRQWDLPATSREDAVLHLWGRYPHATRSGQVSALWILYHPELVTPELLGGYDRVFVASDDLARRLAGTCRVPVLPLHQATDPEDLAPRREAPHHELLLVGNSRGTRRTILDDLGPTERDLAVFGAGWEPDLLDPRYLRGSAVSHEELGAYYASADIVLNDHWPEAAEAGLINNRLYDIFAAGGFVISDRVDGIDEEFDGAVVVYDSPSDLALKVDRYLADPAARAAHTARGRAAVLARHTFGHRVERVLEELMPLVEGRGS